MAVRDAILLCDESELLWRPLSSDGPRPSGRAMMRGLIGSDDSEVHRALEQLLIPHAVFSEKDMWERVSVAGPPSAGTSLAARRSASMAVLLLAPPDPSNSSEVPNASTGGRAHQPLSCQLLRLR